MNKPWEVLATITATDSKNEKQELIAAEADADNDEFFKGCRAALDAMITFGVKKVELATKDGRGIRPEAFWKVAGQLRDRTLTGTAAQVQINFLRINAKMDEWNGWYRLILIKDLKAGFSEVTVNKAVEVKNPKRTIPVFAVQLATDSVDEETGDVDAKFLKGKKFIDTKLDGCLSADWVVEFENGTKVSICEVVDNKLKGKIKSFNTFTGKVEFNEILGWAKDGQDDSVSDYEWFIITLENGVRLPPLTGNHLVFLPKLKCYRRADLLTVNDIILSL